MLILEEDARDVVDARNVVLEVLFETAADVRADLEEILAGISPVLLILCNRRSLWLLGKVLVAVAGCNLLGLGSALLCLGCLTNEAIRLGSKEISRQKFRAWYRVAIYLGGVVFLKL
jgi:hypothetical protein